MIDFSITPISQFNPSFAIIGILHFSLAITELEKIASLMTALVAKNLTLNIKVIIVDFA